MTKQEFIAELRRGLYSLPQEDINDRIAFYSEMIDDRIEEGLTEEVAISEFGSVDGVISQIMSELPLSKLVKAKVKPKRVLRVWEIVLLVLGSPIWLSLLAAAIVIVFSVYIVMWSVIISLWALEFSLIGCSFAGILSAAVFAFQSNIWVGAAMLGAGLILSGISVLLFLGFSQITKGILLLTKNILVQLKLSFIRKGDAK